MNRTYFTFFSITIGLLLLCTSLQAQDSYHVYLDTFLQNQYNLPAVQQWTLPNTETATQAGMYNYNGTTTTFNPGNQPFSLATRRSVTAGPNPWDAGDIFPNTGTINPGDQCLVIIWLRSETPGAKANFYAEHSSTYDKQVISTVKVGNTWKIYAVPFTASAAFPAGLLNFGLHMGYINQVIEYGGMACLNYKNLVNFDQLPILLNNDSYPGIEPDAPWRATAAADIEQVRKANLNVQVLTSGGQALAGATVHVEMLQHAFKFGTAVVSNKFNGGWDYNPVYEEKLLNLDGKGHGFNEVVFENDLKWPGWEGAWFSTKTELQSDVQWLKNKGITIRGHNLAWPNWTYSPSDINPSVTPAYLKNRVRTHIKDILSYPGIGTEMIDWDVLNEITANVQYADFLAGTPGYTTGRELYVEIFKQADSLAPNSVLYLNDYVAIELGDATNQGIEVWKSRLDELVAAGAPVEGIGFQGHFSATPTGIPRVKAIYDEFYNTYGLESKVTEYDIDALVPQATQAKYMRDILTITFAHPSQKGFLMWGFWDGAHWLGNAPLFREDWSLKPSGAAFIDQVFHQWWTDTTGLTNAAGNYSTRGFKGTYRITITCADGSTQTEVVDLEEDVNLVFQSNCLATNTLAAQASNFYFQVAPNITRDGTPITLQWNPNGLSGQLPLCMYDAMGKLMFKENVQAQLGQYTRVLADLPAGAYIVRLGNASARVLIQSE